MKEKVDPISAHYDALYDVMPANMVQRGMTDGTIEIAPLAFMRGRTPQICLRHPRRSAEHHAAADEDVPDPPRRGQPDGGERRSTQVDLPNGVVSGLDEAVKLLNRSRASPMSASPAPMSCVILWSPGSSKPMNRPARSRRAAKGRQSPPMDIAVRSIPRPGGCRHRCRDHPSAVEAALDRAGVPRRRRHRPPDRRRGGRCAQPPAPRQGRRNQCALLSGPGFRGCLPMNRRRSATSSWPPASFAARPPNKASPSTSTFATWWFMAPPSAGP